MELRSYLEERIEALRKNGSKFKVSKDKLILMAANNSLKGANDIRYIHYNEFKDEIHRLVNMNILVPIGKERIDILSYTDFWIMPKEYEDYDVDLYLHTLNNYMYFDMSYYKLKYNEFLEDKVCLDILYEYRCRKEKKQYTTNELGFLLFKDEKAFEQKEGIKVGKEDSSLVGFALSIMKKISLSFEDLNTYVTNYPFYYHVQESFFTKDRRKILIIENKDTFYTLAWNEKLCTDYDMFIFGEGQKINSSFSIAPKFNIKTTDTVEYFGDIDPIGFSIYTTLKARYWEYSITLCTYLYELLLDKYSINELKIIRKNHDLVNMSEIAKIVSEEFPSEVQSKLMDILVSKKYIPQEGIRFCFE